MNQSSGNGVRVGLWRKPPRSLSTRAPPAEGGSPCEWCGGCGKDLRPGRRGRYCRRYKADLKAWAKALKVLAPFLALAGKGSEVGGVG